MTREELIAALETATGPSRELDVEIGLLLAPEGAHRTPDRPAGTYAIAPGECRQAPWFTASLDAALTLVPEGMWWHVGAGRTRPDEPLYGAIILWPGDDPQPPYACDEVGAVSIPPAKPSPSASRR